MVATADDIVAKWAISGLSPTAKNERAGIFFWRDGLRTRVQGVIVHYSVTSIFIFFLVAVWGVSPTSAPILLLKEEACDTALHILLPRIT